MRRGVNKNKFELGVPGIELGAHNFGSETLSTELPGNFPSGKNKRQNPSSENNRYNSIGLLHSTAFPLGLPVRYLFLFCQHQTPENGRKEKKKKKEKEERERGKTLDRKYE